ncbi:hypothetical protein ACHAO4_006121 [Trichoderma viride]
MEPTNKTIPDLEIVPTETPVETPVDQTPDQPVVEFANRTSKQITTKKPQKFPKSRLVGHRGRCSRRNTCRKGKIDDLDYDNVTFEGMDRTSTAGGAARTFISRDERTVSLVVGVVEEGIWQIKQAIACSEISFQATMFPIPGTEWKPRASDIDVYGIEANDQPRAYMLVIILDEGFKRELLPEVGCSAQIFISIAQRPHKAPVARLSTGQTFQTARRLQDHFATATSMAVNRLAEAQKKLAKLEEREADEEEIEKQRIFTEAVYDRTYLEHATSNTYDYISTVSVHITLEMPNATDDFRRWMEAQLIAKELRVQPGEDEIAHLERIQTWLGRQQNIIRPVVNQGQSEPWKGCRVNLPTGVHENVALFYVEVPLQAGWPYNFKRPPLIVDAPNKVPVHLGTYFANVTCEKKILARVEYDVDDKSLRCEANAVNLMNNVEDNSSATEWWEYILAFNPDLITRELDLWERFPGIADGAANGRFVGQHLKAAHILKKTKQGKVIIAGGPGSGKTHFGTLVAQAVVEGGVVDTSPNLISGRTVRKAEDKAEGQAQNMSDPKAGDDEIDTTEDAWGAQTNLIRNRIPGPAAAGMTWAQLKEQVTQQAKAPRKSLVVWTAPQNTQVADAVIRLRNMMQDKIIIRVHTWKAEIAALLDASARILEVMELSNNATPTECTIIHLMNTLRQKEFIKRSPAANPYSISSQLRARAMADPEANRLMFEI